MPSDINTMASVGSYCDGHIIYNSLETIRTKLRPHFEKNAFVTPEIIGRCWNHPIEWSNPLPEWKAFASLLMKGEPRSGAQLCLRRLFVSSENEEVRSLAPESLSKDFWRPQMLLEETITPIRLHAHQKAPRSNPADRNMNIHATRFFRQDYERCGDTATQVAIEKRVCDIMHGSMNGRIVLTHRKTALIAASIRGGREIWCGWTPAVVSCGGRMVGSSMVVLLGIISESNTAAADIAFGRWKAAFDAPPPHIMEQLPSLPGLTKDTVKSFSTALLANSVIVDAAKQDNKAEPTWPKPGLKLVALLNTYQVQPDPAEVTARAPIGPGVSRRTADLMGSVPVLSNTIGGGPMSTEEYRLVEAGDNMLIMGRSGTGKL